jgi:hypothetical protein
MNDGDLRVQERRARRRTLARVRKQRGDVGERMRRPGWKARTRVATERAVEAPSQALPISEMFMVVAEAKSAAPAPS